MSFPRNGPSFVHAPHKCTYDPRKGVSATENQVRFSLVVWTCHTWVTLKERTAVLGMEGGRSERVGTSHTRLPAREEGHVPLGVPVFLSSGLFLL